MQTSKTGQELSSNDLIWYLLGEYSVGEMLPDPEKGDKTAGEMLSEIVLELSKPVEGIENVGMTLRSVAREALAHFKKGRLEFPGRVRIFCQKKMLDQEIKGGGWGYFVIERSRDAITSKHSDHFIDLYLYEEGE